MTSFGSPPTPGAFSYSTPTPRVRNNVTTKRTQHSTNPLPPTVEESESIDNRIAIRPTTQLELADDGNAIGLPDEVSGLDTVFRNDVRRDWIDATFGPDFFPTQQLKDGTEMAPPPPEQIVVPRQGVGLSRIESYVAYTATIPAGACYSHPPNVDPTATAVPSSEKDSGDAASASAASAAAPKIGVTLSRIPIGLYVRTVDLEGEAHAAGVVPGSVLIDINGLGMLGEPTNKALERMWQYEGHFQHSKKSNNDGEDLGQVLSSESEHGETNGRRGSTTPADGNGGVQGPVALRFIKDGKVYTAVLMAKAPFGISWAPVGNFALVQRAYSYAANAGVRRGCLLAAVNGTSFRDMDHADTAGLLKDIFSRGEKITLTLAYTPAASRTGHHDRAPLTTTNSVGGKDVKSSSGSTASRTKVVKNGDVEVKIHPLEYSLGNLLTCGANRMPLSPEKTKSRQQYGGVSDLANRVASGEILAPSGASRRFYGGFGSVAGDSNSIAAGNMSLSDVGSVPLNKYSPCPSLPKEHFVSKWDALGALVYCIRLHTAGYSEEKFRDIGGVYNLPKYGNNLYEEDMSTSGEKLVTLHTPDAYTEFLRDCAFDAVSAKAFDAYLMQIVNILSSPELLDQFDTDESQPESVSAEQLSEEIFDIILDVALENDDLSQRLHFLLQAFISAPEEGRHSNSFSSDDSRNAFSPLRVLQYAQQRLQNGLLERAAVIEEEALTVAHSSSSLRSGVSSGLPIESNNISPQQESPLSPEKEIEKEVISASKGKYLSLNSPTSTGSQNNTLEASQKKTKKKSMSKKLLSVFRGSSKESKRDSMNGANGFSETNSENVEGAKDTPDNEVLFDEKDIHSASKDQPISPSTSRQDEDSQTSMSQKQPASILRNTAPSRPQVKELQNPFDSAVMPDFLPASTLFSNMSSFLTHLDVICATIEKTLLKSVSKKITDWALQPWSPSKANDLERVTEGMRDQLRQINSREGDSCDDLSQLPLMNPVNSSELLVSIDPEKSYIIPSAHFPLLLSFNMTPYQRLASGPETPRVADKGNEFHAAARTENKESLYRVRVEVVALRGSGLGNSNEGKVKKVYVVHGALAGSVQETGRSTLDPHFGSTTHCWYDDNILCFDTWSSWGPPKTLSLKVSSVSIDEDGYDQVASADGKGTLHYSSEVGYSWANLTTTWDRCSSSKVRSSILSCPTQIWSYDSGEEFDQHGEPLEASSPVSELDLELRVTTKVVESHQEEATVTCEMDRNQNQQKRMLLYKHDDDLRQEMLAVQFVETCDFMLKASGLDLKILTFKCLPVGANIGFIEWLSGTVALSEICKPPGSSCNGIKIVHSMSNEKNDDSTSDGSISNSQATSRPGDWCKHESLRSLRQRGFRKNNGAIGLDYDNPIQDFLRSAAYDPEAPYFIQKDVMDTYVKSCAGYCVITYLLAVGDRHLDNILLHPNGHFLHCDYNFILGQDPKTYLPMRITKEMVLGMGGQESDNFAMFLSYAGAAFLALRRHNNLRALLSLVRNMAFAGLPDVSRNQSTEDAVMAMKDRFRLDLDENEAVSFIEKVIETSTTSKLWLAVDVVHSLGKRF